MRQMCVMQIYILALVVFVCAWTKTFLLGNDIVILFSAFRSIFLSSLLIGVCVCETYNDANIIVLYKRNNIIKILVVHFALGTKMERSYGQEKSDGKNEEPIYMKRYEHLFLYTERSQMTKEWVEDKRELRYDY